MKPFHARIFLSRANESSRGVRSFVPWRRNLRRGSCRTISAVEGRVRPFLVGTDRDQVLILAVKGEMFSGQAGQLNLGRGADFGATAG